MRRRVINVIAAQVISDRPGRRADVQTEMLVGLVSGLDGAAPSVPEEPCWVMTDEEVGTHVNSSAPVAVPNRRGFDDLPDRRTGRGDSCGRGVRPCS